MVFLDYLCAEGLVLCVSMPEHFDVVETIMHARHEDICRIMAEGLDGAHSVLRIGANDNSAV